MQGGSFTSQDGSFTSQDDLFTIQGGLFTSQYGSFTSQDGLTIKDGFSFVKVAFTLSEATPRQLLELRTKEVIAYHTKKSCFLAKVSNNILYNISIQRKVFSKILQNCQKLI